MALCKFVLMPEPLEPTDVFELDLPVPPVKGSEILITNTSDENLVFTIKEVALTIAPDRKSYYYAVSYAKDDEGCSPVDMGLMSGTGFQTIVR